MTRGGPETAGSVGGYVPQPYPGYHSTGVQLNNSPFFQYYFLIEHNARSRTDLKSRFLLPLEELALTCQRGA